MENESDLSLEPTAAQLRYATVLEKGMYVGLVTLLVTFAVYIFEVLEHFIPSEEIPVHWSKSVHEYLADANIETGWNWVYMLGHGDFINFIGIAMLAGTSILCYLSIVPILIKNKDYIYAVLVLLEVVVLTVAASGVISVGH